MNYELLVQILPKEPKQWKQADVAKWLEFIDLKHLASKFETHAVDGSLLITLDDNDLKEMGIIDTIVKLKKLYEWMQFGFTEYAQYVKDYRAPKSLKSINLETSAIHNSRVGQSVVSFSQEQVLSNYVTQQVLQPPKLSQSDLKEKKLKLMDLSGDKVYDIAKSDFTIGRSPENSLVLKEDYISRFHCKIIYKEQYHTYYLQDMGSSSGTYILLDNPTLLKEGIILQMGSEQFLLKQLIRTDNRIQVFIEIIDGISKGENVDFELMMDQTSLIFGRSLSMFGDDGLLSSNHAQFTFIQEGLVIEDLNSRNGTWLRMSAPQSVSEPIKITHSRRFRLALEKIFDCELSEVSGTIQKLTTYFINRGFKQYDISNQVSTLSCSSWIFFFEIDYSQSGSIRKNQIYPSTERSEIGDKLRCQIQLYKKYKLLIKLGNYIYNEQQQMELNFIFFPKPEATYTELNLKNCQIGYVQGRAQRKIPFAYSSRPGARCLFLYFHGNAEDVGYANYMMREIQEDLGFPAEYACIEYPGYGIYTGISPTAELIEEDAEDVFKHFSEFQKPIIIIGRSMGSGPACYLASKYQAKGLILISAYESLEQLAKDKAGFLSYLVKQRFNNLERAVDIKMPTLLIHGKADPLIQYTHSETIHQRIKHNHKQLIVIEHMTHNDFHLGEDITKNIREFCLPLLIR